MSISSDPASSPIQDGLPEPRRFWAVIAIFMTLTMAVLDGAIANVALPTITQELHAKAASAIWILNAYQLAITMLLLPLASFGERIGYRKLYLTGIVVFTIGSLACALSHTLPQLICARVLQGLGASGIMSINAALVRFTYPQRLLARGLALNAMVIATAAALGPTVASAILSVAGWQWLFAVNVPVGVATVAMGLWALPHTEGSHRRFDIVSALLSATAFGLMVLGADSIVREGLVLGLTQLAIAAVAGVLLVLRELPRATPLIPIDLLRIPVFRLSIMTSLCAFGAQALAYVALPFNFQEELGRSVVATGLLMTPWPLGTALAAPLAARFVDRYHAGVLGAIGMAAMGAGMLALALMGPNVADWDIAWRMALCGAGFGFFQTPNNKTLLTAAPFNRSGAAGGALATARLLGQVTGAGVMGMLFHLLTDRAIGVALLVAALVAAVATAVSLLRLRVATT